MSLASFDLETKVKQTSSLLSLPQELLSQIVRELSVSEIRKLITSCKDLYQKAKPEFDINCFRVIPVNLTEESLCHAQNLLDTPQSVYVREIRVRFPPTYLDRYGLERFRIEKALASVLIQGIGVSTSCVTISVREPNAEKFTDFEGAYMKTAGRAISAAVSAHPTIPFQVQIQSLQLVSCMDLANVGRTFLDKIQSIELRIDESGTSHSGLRYMMEILSLTTQLEEFSFLNTINGFIAGSYFLQIIKKCQSPILRSLTISGIYISATRLMKNLNLFGDSLKEVTMELVLFKGKFDEFVSLLDSELPRSLERLSFNDIWAHDDQKIYQVLDPMQECKNMGVRGYCKKPLI